MDAIDRYGDNGYWSLDGAIKQVMRRSAGDAVLLGYLLRRMMDEKLWAGQYDSLDGYLREELHMDYTMACRFEAINRKYSVGGYSKDIDEKYGGFSQGVLIEMLNMPPELEAKVTPDMTVRQVREVKRQARQEKLKEEHETAVAENPVTAAPAEGKAEPVEEVATSQPQEEPEEQLMGQMKVEDFPELLPESWHGEMAEGQDEIPDAEYRELDSAEEVATSQLPELVKPDKRQGQYLDDFAKSFIASMHDWMLADYRNRVLDVTKSPEEMKRHLGEDGRTWYFPSGEDKVAHIDMFDDYVQLWDGKGDHMGDFDWFYLAASIQRMWNVVALETANRPAGMEPRDAGGGRGCGPRDTARQEASAAEEALAERGSRTTDGLAEVKRILAKEQKMLDDFLKASVEDKSVLESQMFKRLAIIVDALTAMVRSMEETEAGKDGPEEREQPPLPPLRNNDQRREWLKSYKDWGLWYRDGNIGADYYKYDFENGARLIAEVYQEDATKYHGPYESCFLHLVGGPEPPTDQHGASRWQRHGRYSRYPNSETELVEFLKELQRKGWDRGCAGC